MKQKLTFLLTAVLLLATTLFPLRMTGQTRDVYSYTFSAKVFDANNQTKTLYDVDWTFAGTTTAETAYFGYTEAKGQQFGSGAAPFSAFTLSTSGISGTITEIKVNTSGASSIAGTLIVTVGDDVFGESYPLTSTATEVTFAGSASGEIAFNYEQTSSKAIYIKSITVTYTPGEGPQTVSTPTFSPEGGSYSEAQSVTISCATEDATIYYTTDGSEPNELSQQYSVALNISETTTIKAKAYKSGFNPSSIATATYTFPSESIDYISSITTEGTFTVQGTIVAKSQRGFIVGDGTGYVYYYNTSYAQTEYNIGDMVKLSGSVVTYGGVFEFNNSTVVTAATSSNYVTEDPTILTGADMDARVASTTPAQLSNYVQYAGKLSVNGNYYNITDIDGATTAKGSISFPLDTDFASLDGRQVIVKGYYVGISSSQYYNTMLGSIEASTVVEPSFSVSPTELTGFQYLHNAGPSQVLSFTATGSDLTENVNFTIPQDFEISLNEEGTFSDNLALSPAAGSHSNTIYVRMKEGLDIGTHSSTINIITGDLTAIVELSGTVLDDESPILTANPTSLSGFTYDAEEGGPSEIKSFNLSGEFLTGPARVFPSESFEVSTLGDDSFLAENPANVFSPGNFQDITIYVRLKAGLEVGTYEEQLLGVSEGADTLFFNVSGTVTGDTPTPPDPPAPGDGNYVRISELSGLADGDYVIMAARFDSNVNDYYAMTNASSGKPTGVLFTSATANENEVLPASIVNEENSYYWVVGVTENGYTFTNANGELIGYGESGTDFITGGEKIEWNITMETAGGNAMVPEYTGFYITNATTTNRGFALNNQHNFGAYAVSNNNGNTYNFYLDLFVKTEGGTPPTPTVATPTFTPVAGTYDEAQTVSIVCSTEGAIIHYTLDATTPTESSPVYSAPLTIEETTTVKAIAMKEGYNNSNVAEATYTIQTGSGSATIFDQDWEDGWHGWTQVSVAGDSTWRISQYNSNHFAYMNAYNDVANEDWLISPAFNVNEINNPILTFRTARKYNGPEIEVYFSSDYNGSTPATATWQPLTCTLSTGNNWIWAESGNINLSGFSGTNCYIAFKYTSTDSQAAGWEIDDITLVGLTSDPIVTVTPLTLTGFSYVEGNGPSTEQSFTVSGFNLNNNITISDATHYEISLTSGEEFVAQNTLTLTVSGGNLEETAVYVRLKAGLDVGEYNDEDITIACADVYDMDVTCSGVVNTQPIAGDNFVRISNAGTLVDGNKVILAARYNGTANAYLAVANTVTSGKLTTTEFTSTMNGTEEIIPDDIVANEDSYYWTVGINRDGYTFTNAAGNMIGYGSSGTNLIMNGEKTVWNIATGVSSPESLVPEYFGFNIVNATTDSRSMALRVTETDAVVKAYAASNMTDGEYNFFLDIFMQGEGGVPPTPTVATPTFTPGAGTYYETQDVVINCTTPDATIYYSLDSESGPWEEYEEAVTVDESMTIWAYAIKEGYNNSPVVSAEYIIQHDLVIIFNQDWEEDWHGWTQQSMAGDSTWRIHQHNGNHYAYINAYQDVANEDWLISPAFNLDSYSDVVLTFSTARNYTGPDIEVYFSNDYDGADPSAATWQGIECPLSTGSWNWVESGQISLNEFSGSNCYIAFKYISTDEQAAGWEVDDIMLVSGGAVTIPTLTATPNTISGLEYIEGEGPSNSQSYTLTGTNLVGEGNVIVTASENFEISIDNEYFTEELTLMFADGEIVNQPATVYVRLVEDLEVGSYMGSISHQGGEASTEVSLTGVVRSENEPMIEAFMPFYIQGNNGSNNNRVPVAIAVYLENLEPSTTYRYTNQFVDSNDGPETAGAGNVIYANEEGFYRSTSPSLSTEGGYGEFTTDEDGLAFAWFMNEPTANARFTPGNQVYLRIRLNDGHDGTNVEHTFTTPDYATVLNFGTEYEEYSGTAFYAKSDEAPMSFAMLFTSDEDERPVYSTSIETIGVDFGSINQYADFYKDEVAGNDGWFGGILPNDNKPGINSIWIVDMGSDIINEYNTQNGEWQPEANTINPNAGLDSPIFIDLTDDGVNEDIVANVKVWSTEHEFVIENSDNAHYMMTVYNVLGQPMMRHQINAGSTERISHSLASGVYVISLQNNQSNASVKVIVR